MVLVVVGRDFFFMLPAKAGSTFSILNGPAPQVTHYIRQLMVSLSNFPLHALCLHAFLKKVIPASAGETFLKIDPHHFASKNTTFWIPNWSFKLQFSSLYCSLPLLCSLGSLFFAFGANLEPTWGELGSHLGQLGGNFGDLGANFG